MSRVEELNFALGMPFRKASAPAGRRKDRSLPQMASTAASIYGNFPEMRNKALRSTRNSGTDRAESSCSPRARAAPYPMCTTQAEHSLGSLRRGCTASACLPRSKYFGEGFPILAVMPPVLPDRAPSFTKAFFVCFPFCETIAVTRSGWAIPSGSQLARHIEYVDCING